MPARITCPSGLSGIVRGLGVKEIEVLADKDLFKTGEYMDEFLRRCWVETTDAFAYPLDAAKKQPLWGKVLACDRFYAYVQIRRATWGDDYPLDTQCVAPGCRELLQLNIPIPKLSVIELPEESRKAFADGNRLETYFGRQVRYEPVDPENPDGEQREAEIIDPGKRVIWALPTGEAQWRLAKDRRTQKKLKPNQKQNPLLDALMMRIVEVEGVDTKTGLRRWLEAQELKPVRELFDHMDEQDGGIETDVPVTCQYCDSAWKFSLPFGPEFIFPDKGLRKRSS